MDPTITKRARRLRAAAACLREEAWDNGTMLLAADHCLELADTIIAMAVRADRDARLAALDERRRRRTPCR